MVVTNVRNEMGTISMNEKHTFRAEVSDLEVGLGTISMVPSPFAFQLLTVSLIPGAGAGGGEANKDVLHLP